MTLNTVSSGAAWDTSPTESTASARARSASDTASDAPPNAFAATLAAVLNPQPAQVQKDDSQGANSDLDASLEALAGSARAATSASGVSSGARAGASAAPVTNVSSDADALNPEFRARLGRVVTRMNEEYGHSVEIVEGFRPQARQEFLYEQGRTRPGDVVTWTKSSKHTLGMAADVKVDGSYDNPSNEYVIKLRGSEMARSEVMPRFLMALNTGGVVSPIEGIDGVDPSFGMPARWIAANRRADAEAYGYVVVEPSTVVATHLMEVLKTNAAELLGRQDVQEMVETLKKTHPALVEDIVPAKISLGTLHRVLQRLLRERIPIRDLVTILEALGDAADTTKDPEALTEQVRRSLCNVIARLYAEPDASVRGITVGPRLEQALTGLFSPRTAQPGLPLLNPDALARLLRELNDMSSAYSSEGRPVPLVTPASLRVGVRRLIEPVLPSVPVISLAELPAVVNLHSVGMWELANAA